MRDLEVGMLGVGSTHCSAHAVPEAGIDDAADSRSRRNRASRSEYARRQLWRTCCCNRRSSWAADRGGRCHRATNRGLYEQCAHRGDLRENDLRIRFIARASQLDRREQLTDAREQPVIVNSKARADDGTTAECIRQADARLKIV